jgi:oligoribonuclease
VGDGLSDRRARRNQSEVLQVSERRHSYVWIDLETEGLDPRKHRILEFAIILAADDCEGDMSIVEEYQGVLAVSAAEQEARITDGTIDPYVLRMHKDNGLWSECATTDATAADLDALLCELCVGASPRSIMLAGNSVHFDASFLRVHCPRFARFMSHSVLDVTTLLSACENWGTPIERLSSAHRALGDIRNSLEYARKCRQAMGLGAKGAAS